MVDALPTDVLLPDAAAASSVPCSYDVFVQFLCCRLAYLGFNFHKRGYGCSWWHNSF